MNHDGKHGPGTGIAAVFSIKLPIILAWFLLWNAGVLFSVHLNGGFGPIENEQAAWVLCGSCIAHCVFAMAIASSETIQRLVVAESRRESFLPDPFAHLAGLFGVLGFGGLLFEVL